MPRPQAVGHLPIAQAKWPWMGGGPAVHCHTPNISPSTFQFSWLYPHLRATSPSRGDQAMAILELNWVDPTWLWCLYRPHKTMAHCEALCCLTKWCSPSGSNGCTYHRVSWRANYSHAHTMYIASYLQVMQTIQAGWSHACQGSTTI